MLSEKSTEMLDEFIVCFQQKANFEHRKTIQNLVEKVIIEQLNDGLKMIMDHLLHMRTFQYTSFKKCNF